MRTQTPTPEPRPDRGHEWSWPNFFRNAVLIALTITGLVILYVKQIQTSLEPLNFGEITEDEIYRSGRPSAAAADRATRLYNLKTVIDLGTYPIGSDNQNRLESTYRALGLAYHRLPLYGDGTGDPNVYAQALRTMTDPANQPVLVHCGSGAQRTSGLTTLYRYIVQGMGLDEAFAESLDYRHNPAGNPALRTMLDRWAEPIAELYSSGGLIEYDGPARAHGGRATEPLAPLASADPVNVGG
ncbi:MAG: protein tyrosine phosphatase (PTP) superfamily phosphohydrolase (DUF442 family) [Phycisphaerales bacterium]|jgi:protein tyrosine phosphatase (PTP) superfamily phosphohydrolase (DUF442 family)